MPRFLLISLLICCTLQGFAQRKVLQFSGIVVTEDSLQAVPYTNIYVANKGRRIAAIT